MSVLKHISEIDEAVSRRGNPMREKKKKGGGGILVARR